MIVAFTGHRPDKIGGYAVPNPTYDRIVRELEWQLLWLGPVKAISGMALGVDQWAAQICVNLGIPFVAAVPFAGQERMWPQASVAVYEKLIAKAAEVVVVCKGGYTASKMQERNRWMVDRCDVLIAVWDGSCGGTGNCVEYAHKVKKR